jgi:hypothetical protein
VPTIPSTSTESGAGGRPPAIKLNGSEKLYLQDQDAQNEAAVLRRRASAPSKDDLATASKRRKSKGKDRGGGVDADMLKSRGLWNDWKSGRWMIIPCTS